MLGAAAAALPHRTPSRDAVVVGHQGSARPRGLTGPAAPASGSARTWAIVHCMPQTPVRKGSE